MFWVGTSSFYLSVIPILSTYVFSGPASHTYIDIIQYQKVNKPSLNDKVTGGVWCLVSASRVLYKCMLCVIIITSVPI